MPPQQPPTTIKLLSGNKYTGNGTTSRALVNKAHSSFQDILRDRPNVCVEVACDNEWFGNDYRCIDRLAQFQQQQRAGGAGRLVNPQHHQPAGNTPPLGRHDNALGHTPANELLVQLLQQYRAGSVGQPADDIPPLDQYGNAVGHIPMNELLTELLQQHGAGGLGELVQTQHHQPDDRVGNPAGGNQNLGFHPSLRQYGNGVGHLPIDGLHAAFLEQEQPID